LQTRLGDVATRPLFFRRLLATTPFHPMGHVRFAVPIAIIAEEHAGLFS